jgi:hypothetical protein
MGMGKTQVAHDVMNYKNKKSKKASIKERKSGWNHYSKRDRIYYLDKANKKASYRLHDIEAKT